MKDLGKTQKVKYIFFCVMILLVVTIVGMIFIFTTVRDKKEKGIWKLSPAACYAEATIYGVKWKLNFNLYLYYESTDSVDATDKKFELVMISADYSTTEKINGSIAFIHNIQLTGVPLQDKHWFLIEKTEIINPYYDLTQIAKQTTTRHEEKIIFTIFEDDIHF